MDKPAAPTSHGPKSLTGAPISALMTDGPGEPKSVEGAAPSSIIEKVFQRRSEVHLAVKPCSPISSNGDAFRETLIHGSAAAAAPSLVVVAPGKRSEGGEFHEHGLDPELSFRITFRRIGAGLANLGNTCFLNSVLQCLTYTEPFAAYLQSGKHKSSCHTSGFCAMCALQNHVMNALQSTGKILSPSHLVKNLRCISRNFRNARQEDAHEYMVNLLESMHRCCLPSGVPSESPSAYDKSLVHKIFGGRLRSQVKCMQCSYCSNKFDPFLDLSLEIVKADSLRKALSHFTAMEQLDGGERQYQCQRCKQQVRALKQLTIHKAPYVLTIHLKRFGSVVPGQKIDKKVEFEPALDLKPFVSDPHEVNLKYTLYGVLVHAGWSTHSGHYYCFVRTSSGMWHSLDDNQVRQVSEKTVFQQKAYMLFYVRDRDSTVKKSIDVVCKENIPTNTSGHRVHTPVSGMNGTIQNPMVDRNLSTLENTCSISKSDATCHGQSNPAVNSSSQHSLQKKAYSLQKSENDTPKQGSIVQNFSRAVLKEPSGLQLNLCILAKDVQKEVHSNSSINFSSSDNSLLKRPLVTSAVNQKVTDDLAQTAKLKKNGVATTSYTDVASLAVVNAQMNNGYHHPKGCHLDVKSGVNHAQMNNFGLLNSSSEKHSDKKFAKNSTDENCNANGSLWNINSASNVATDEIAAKLAPENTYGRSSYMNGCTQKETFSAKNVDCKDIDKENEKYSSNAQCQKGGERAVKPEGTGLADASKESCTHNGPRNKEIHAVKGKESSVGDYHQAKGKRKKPAKLILSRAMHFCHKQLFLTSLSMRKNKQHKKCRKHLKHRNLLKDKDNPTTNNHQASTSEAITSSVVNSKSSRKRSRSNSDQESDCRAKNVKMENGDFISFKVRVDKCRKNGVMPTTSEQPQECLSPNANQLDARETNAHSRGPDQHGFLSMLMRGLKETTVLHWDDAELPQSQNYALEDGCINNIGYVLDEWDEEYDQGKRKKVKKSRHSFGGPNPFQEAANKKAQQMMRVKAMGLTSSGNEPFRI